ncbi:hypothetical protein [Salinisphaera sp. Q1T1-3]|uniref:hypothetical protein n=1 Tax=Salinisphaera sp. Q1T1-3 TaxID=2321229 RepID=UPI000E742920|nr:hypothetical protein [Salinisphaera sp. Q1T1-3]RJS94736.1 hypothetical protein D3260_02875 [Salinisphaera sp. Q1T1-3]
MTLFEHGHIAWPLFAALVYSALVFLGADLAWRCIRLPVQRLAVCVLLVWLGGLLVIGLVS